MCLAIVALNRKDLTVVLVEKRKDGNDESLTNHLYACLGMLLALLLGQVEMSKVIDCFFKI
jgi:hypothetical protein